jgi:hypothetical protein
MPCGHPWICVDVLSTCISLVGFRVCEISNKMLKGKNKVYLESMGW